MLMFRLFFLLALLFISPVAGAFGVDVCFNDPESSNKIIRNCIGVEKNCRKQPLSARENVQCRILATADSLGGLSGTNDIIGGRSTLHSDSVYLIAQLNGFSAWQAYQIMIYSEATDQSAYEPFNQSGYLMMSAEEMDACYKSDMAYRKCLAITPKLSGVYKFNDKTGGQLLHLHARYAEDASPPENTPYPADYLADENVVSERLINNLKAWAFDERPDACVSGITTDPTDIDAPCLADHVLDFPMNFFSFGYAGAAIPFQAETGVFILNETPRVLSTEEDMDAYLPHDPKMARLGVFLHSLADRVSHHMCTDEAYFYKTETDDYTSVYPSRPCAQGNHFLWHAWEQGTNQRNIEDEEFRTLEQALNQIWNMLESRAQTLNLSPPRQFNRHLSIRAMVGAMGIYDPKQRLNAVTRLIEYYGFPPLPGHGSYRRKSLETWLDDVQAEAE
jgi:hypothetical protein